MVPSPAWNDSWKWDLTFASVPGSSQKMLDKTQGLTADCVAYDLEDSVTPGKKAEARANIRRFLEQPKASGIKEYAVRINAVGSGYEADDISEVVWARAITYWPPAVDGDRPTHLTWIPLSFPK